MIIKESPDNEYFGHHYLSNSDLKKLRKMLQPESSFDIDPGELEEIFEFGHLVEDCIFAPHQANYAHRDIEKALEMARTFRGDKLCQEILLAPDLRRQHQWYRNDVYGVHARCMADADSKWLSLIFEFKGLSVNNEASFYNAIDRYDYDMGLAWYLDTTHYKRAIIVAASKTNTKKLFKCVVDREHPIYLKGLYKAINHVQEVKALGLNLYQ
jgi:hypothetical protein